MFVLPSAPLLTTTICLLFSLVSSHTVITYPGQRGNNLHTFGNVSDTNGLGETTLGRNDTNPYGTYPYGMQWMYPCGGMQSSKNRTLWPVGGGAVGFQPGWFNGHASAFLYINLGDGTLPENFSMIMQPVFEITGPQNTIYNGSICLPHVSLPVNYTAVIGHNATIQVIELAQHGAALYNCVDITFADPKDVPEVNESNCANTSNIGFELVFSTDSLTSGAEVLIGPVSWALASIPLAAATLWALLV
ncbi:MAG: hypothetical protein Q9195_002041 [Heterodermia aff. obscurata]